jgi:hypothetical protein
VSHARTVWEEGREPGHQVVALGVAVALTAVLADLTLTGGVGVLFDVAFVLLCVLLALRVRPADFFTAGVLPPLLMVAVFLMLGVDRPATIAEPGDGTVQAVVSGLSHHSEALVTGYLLCLVVLLVRSRVVGRAITRSDPGPRLRA